MKRHGRRPRRVRQKHKKTDWSVPECTRGSQNPSGRMTCDRAFWWSTSCYRMRPMKKRIQSYSETCREVQRCSVCHLNPIQHFKGTLQIWKIGLSCCFQWVCKHSVGPNNFVWPISAVLCQMMSSLAFPLIKGNKPVSTKTSLTATVTVHFLLIISAMTVPVIMQLVQLHVAQVIQQTHRDFISI